MTKWLLNNCDELFALSCYNNHIEMAMWLLDKYQDIDIHIHIHWNNY